MNAIPAIDSVDIRLGTQEDSADINHIYNWYIENTIVTFDIEPWPLDRRRDWTQQFNQQGSHYFLWVASIEGKVLGFACNGMFRPKAAYNQSTEVSVYVDHDCQTKGIGSILFQHLFDSITSSLCSNRFTQRPLYLSASKIWIQINRCVE